MVKHSNNGEALEQWPFVSESSYCELFIRQFILSVPEMLLLWEQMPLMAKLFIWCLRPCDSYCVQGANQVKILVTQEEDI